jgi:hypothetical protein
MQNPLIQLQNLFRSLANEVVAAANAEPKARGWTEVTLDTRYSPHGSMQFRTIRAKVAGRSVDVDGLYGNLAGLTREIRMCNQGEPFFGFILTISDQGEVDIRLNYDPNCYNDPNIAAT